MTKPDEPRRVEAAAPAPAASASELERALELERARAREMDHRAKNSLQLISSLLLLSSRRAGDPAARAALHAMFRRVGAVAAAHRRFTPTDESAGFDLTGLVREAAGELAREEAARASIRLDLAELVTPPANAVPLALILNELATNALRHAFVDIPPGAVTIGLRQVAGGFALTVQDDGVGLAPGADEGFGLAIVKLMAQQLRAEFTLEDAQPGVRATVKVPVNPVDAS